MAKASWTKARQKAIRSSRKKRNVPSNRVGFAGTAGNGGAWPVSSRCNRWGLACIRYLDRVLRSSGSASIVFGCHCRWLTHTSLDSPRAVATWFWQHVLLKRIGGELLRPQCHSTSVTRLRVFPPSVRRFRPRGASFRERARPLRTQPRLPLVPWRPPLPSLARGARCGSTPCRFRQG
jgi:hypothetical protein